MPIPKSLIPALSVLPVSRLIHEKVEEDSPEKAVPVQDTSKETLSMEVSRSLSSREESHAPVEDAGRLSSSEKDATEENAPDVSPPPNTPTEDTCQDDTSSPSVPDLSQKQVEENQDDPAEEDADVIVVTQFQDLSLREIRKRCTELNLNSQGKKQELITRLQNAVAT